MGESAMQDRREFLKTAGVAAASVGAASLLGSELAHADEAEEVEEAAEEETAAETEDSEEWDEEYDVVVVGAGLAGMCSAVTVATEGDGATCLLLEKSETPMGITPYSGGGLLYCEEPDRFKNYITSLIGDCTPEDVIDAYVDECAQNFDWIKSFGATDDDFTVSTGNLDGENGEYPEIEDDDAARWFIFKDTHVYNFMLDVVDQYSDIITFKTSMPAESLVQATDGTITGVVCEDGTRFKANLGVIMCTGGFENNEDMLQEYLGLKGVKSYAGTSSNTGDGIRMCQKVGADLWHLRSGATTWLAGRNLDNTSFMGTSWNFTTKENGITVGINGRRFYQDYDAGYITTSDTLPDSDMTCNVGYRHGITQFGGEWTHLPLPEKAWFIFDQDGLDNGAVPEDVSTDPVADGWVLTADTIEELADAIEVPSDELVKTVELWNTYCENGEDEAFHRPAETLTPVANPPYYAMMCIPAMLNTDGGPRRSAKGEVLDPYGEPIPHLYSSGELGSIWGNLYQGAGNLGECAAFGRISARSALANAEE